MRTHLALILALSLPSLVIAQGLTPEQAMQRMKLPEGFEVRLVAAEPMVRQPLSISFDGRGRMWVLQYLQYPNPAGLKAVKVDQYLRTVWDRVPEPPPHGPKGVDRITILSEPDATGKYTKSKDFLSDLNLASGFCLGHDGVFVVQPPYLLYYADKNHDDVPDGPPEVLLTGFGMEDSHSYANSLQWGPDGWLYGAHGSTVTANIRGIEFQQGIWRYHPRTKAFELFAEGGGNTFGLDFDREGRVIAGTNWGGKAMLHQVQGAYYIKGFGKHGPLHNPHTYGYFDHVPYTNFKGGHVTCGGVLYLGDTYPPSYQNLYIGGNLLSNDWYVHRMEVDGSSFKASHHGDFLLSGDPWFRPIDSLVGPDGAMNLVDWHDKRAAHLDPVDNWDRTNGRIYKVVYKANAPQWPKLDLDRQSSAELVKLLANPNIWYVREARRILAERRDASIIPALHQLIRSEKGQLALEALFALYVSGGFEGTPLSELLTHPNEHVRAWTVRLIGDEKRVTPAQRDAFIALAKSDASPTVRSQLACTAKRLPGADGLPIVHELLRRTEDKNDPFIPMLCWWAIEDKAISHRDMVLSFFDDPSFWNAPLVKVVIVERLARRYLAEGKEADFAACARLLSKAPNADSLSSIIQGMDKALEGRRLAMVPSSLESPLADLMKKQPNSDSLLRFAVRLGSPAAYEQLLQRVRDAKRSDAERLGWIELLAQSGGADVTPILLELLESAKSDTMRNGVITALQAFPDDVVIDKLMQWYPMFSPGVRAKAQAFFLARPASTLAYLRAVDRGRFSIKEVSLEQARQAMRFKNADITPIIEKYFGKVGAEQSGEKTARITYVNLILSRHKGDVPNGKALFTKNCASCHQLFNEGNKIGPDLTSADRMNRGFMIQNVVDPSGYIRSEYVAFNIETTDGRVLTGLMTESTPQAVTLIDAKNQKTVIARDKIETLEASPVSLMPEKLLDTLSDQEIADLFSYIQSPAPTK